MDERSALHYDYPLDLEADTSGARLVLLTGRGKRVLDLGCAAGGLDRVLVQRGCTVVGVEIDPEAAKLAELACERVLVGDLDRLDLEIELDGDSFDVVLAGDVLEHLKDPARVLRDLRSLMRPGGYVVISVPNVAHGSVRLALAQGTFPRTDRGLLDSTHLQFLTRSTLTDLLTTSGWTAAIMEGTRLPIAASEVVFERDEAAMGLLAELERDPLALVYQHIALAYPVAGPEELEPVPARLRAAQAELAEARGALDELQRQVGSLEAAVGEQAAETAAAREALAASEVTLASERYLRALALVDAGIRTGREITQLNKHLLNLSIERQHEEQRVAAELVDVQAAAEELLAETVAAHVAQAETVAAAAAIELAYWQQGFSDVAEQRDAILADLQAVHSSRLWTAGRVYRKALRTGRKVARR